MTLRKKTILIVSLTLAGLVAALYAASRIVLLGSFAELEQREGHRNVERIVSSVAEDVSTIDHECRNAATWDRAYSFIQNPTPDFVTSEIGYRVSNDAAARRLNLEVYVRSSGQIVFDEGFDLAAPKETPIPEGLRGQLIAGSRLLAQSGASGIVLLPEGPMLIASRPILTTAGKGPIHGSLIMGRLLDATEITRLGERTLLPVSLLHLNDSRLPPGLLAPGLTLSAETPIVVRPVNLDRIAGYAVLRDIYGKPILALGADMPREIYERGRASVLYFVVSLVLVGLIFALVTLLLLEKAVLSRLTALSAGVTRIGKNTDLSARVPLNGKDELSGLAGAINGMLEALERAKMAMRESEERYRLLFSQMITGFALIETIYDPEGRPSDFRYLEVNAAFEKHSSLPAESVLGRTIREVLPDIAPIWNETYGRVATTGETVHFESYIRSVQKWLEVSVFRPRPGQVAMTFADITERKRAQEALRASEERVRLLLESTAEAIYGIDLNGDCTFANPACWRILGYANQEAVLGRNMHDLIHHSRPDGTSSSRVPDLPSLPERRTQPRRR